MPEKSDKNPQDDAQATPAGRIDNTQETQAGESPPAREIGGRKGADPTRYGDWEKNGRCIDF